MRLRLRSALPVGAILALALAVPAAAEPTWAPAGSATITPGSMTSTDGAQCTANFVFFDGAGDVYLGQAAHCSSTSGSTATNGCETESLPLETPVEVEGASRPGELAYNSWLAMQGAGETDEDTCDFNDFALVRLDEADHDKVNPSVPFWGGPTGVIDRTSPLQRVYSYQNSSLRLGLDPLKPKVGESLGQSGGGWNHTVYTVSPGVPGDSGSGFVDDQGRAFGTLSTIALLPLATSNGVSDLSRALAYLDRHSSLDVTLAEGTEPFDPVL